MSVLDPDGKPVPDVAVFVVPEETRRSRAEAGETAVMDQVNLQFAPHVLVVQSGTSVEFPNSDPVAHHVYSFSHPNRFALPIYKGDAPPPVTFDESGVVIVGCNVHDDMLGYILVVDTPAFQKTDASGLAALSTRQPLTDKVRIWSPRIRDEAGTLLAPVGNGQETVTFRLSQPLRPEHGKQSQALSWSEY